jgi:amino-acid N-acetyltransferase
MTGLGHQTIRAQDEAQVTQPSRRRGLASLRTAEPSEAPKLHALIAARLDEGRLLPRTQSDLVAHAGRFVVAVRGRTMVGCGELAPLSRTVAEVRSLAVDRAEGGCGTGRQIVEELRRRARRGGFERLGAFTHTPAYFVRMGFSIVPHLWLTEKILTDCVKCPQFRQCGQYAMVVTLDDAAIRPLGTARGQSVETTHDLQCHLSAGPCA